jgi:hypothetical protein
MNAFEDGEAAVSVGELSIENGTDSIRLFGELVIRKDQTSLRQVEALERHLVGIRLALQSIDPLPEEAAEEATTAAEIVSNPFDLA